jgi:phage baseplate assembly protein W
MDGFSIDSSGDVVISNNKIEMVSNTELICQKVRQLLKTNLGEWWLNENEGIDFLCMLQKNPNYEQIEDNIKSGLKQVDETLEMTSINFNLDANRTLHINFTARNSDNEEIKIEL